MTTLLGVWSLGSVGMLAWGLAAAIPVAIHLWSRRRHVEVSWGAMQFLVAALRRHARRLRVEQLVLLAIRVTSLIVLAVALADPLWSWTPVNPGATPRDPTHFLFVVDTSFSMAFQEGEQTQLQLAQARMRQIIEQAAIGDAFSLVLMERPPRAAAAEVGFDRELMLQQVHQLRIAHAEAELSGTLQLLAESLQQYQARYPRLTRRQIHFFTDLGRNTWKDAGTLVNQAAFERLRQQAELIVEEFGSSERPNLAVTHLSSSRPLATPGETSSLVAEVQAFSSSRPITTQVEFLVGGRVVHAEEVELPPGTPRAVTYVHRWEAAGEQVVSARVAADGLPIDNARWLIQAVRERRSVLCVEGESEAATFVSLALHPRTGPHERVRTTVVPESELLNRDLATFDAVFLCNVGRITEVERDALYDYVAGGGGLVVSVGDQVQADHYNQLFASGAKAILPGKLGALRRGEWFFDPMRYGHPMVSPFRGRERAGLLTVPIWRAFSIEPRRESTVVLGLANAGPVMVEWSVGSGTCVLVGTALSTSSVDRQGESVSPWNALPAWPSFPPLVHGLLESATRGRGQERVVEVGAPLKVLVPSSAANPLIVRPDQQRESLAVEGRFEGHMVAEVATNLCGVYRLEWDSTGMPPGPVSTNYAANLPVRESDLSRVSRTELPESLRDGAAPAGAMANFFTGEGTQPWFRPLLVTVLLLLLLEHLLAVIFARRAE